MSTDAIERDWGLVTDNTMDKASRPSVQLDKEHEKLQGEFRVEYLAFLRKYVHCLAKVDRKRVSREDSAAVDLTITRDELRLMVKYGNLSAAINSKYEDVLLPWELTVYSTKWKYLFQDISARNCTWRSNLDEEETTILVFVVASLVGFVFCLLAVVIYADSGFFFEPRLATFIPAVGFLMTYSWAMAYSATRLYFRDQAGYRTLTPRERAESPIPPWTAWPLFIPIGVWICVWLLLLALQQVHALLAPKVVDDDEAFPAGSCLFLTTLYCTATPLVAAVWCWRRSKWGLRYRMATDIPCYEELYGRIMGNHGGVEAKL